MALWPHPSTADPPDRRVGPPAGTTGRTWHAWRGPVDRDRNAARAHDARGEDRPDDACLSRPGRYRPRRPGRLYAGDPHRRGRHGQQPVGPRPDPRGPAHGARGDAPSASRCSSSWTSSTAIARSSRCRSPRSAPSTRSCGSARRGSRPRRRPPSGLAMTYAPMLDVARDPRWGRIAESAGRRSVARGALAAAKVRGLSGRRPRGRRQSRRHRQASGRLWRGHRRPRLCHGRHLGALACTRSTCRPSGPRSPRASPRSCRRSTTSPACR